MADAKRSGAHTHARAHAPVPTAAPDAPDEEEAPEVRVRLRDVLHDPLRGRLPAGEGLARAPGAGPVVLVLEVEREDVPVALVASHDHVPGLKDLGLLVVHVVPQVGDAPLRVEPVLVQHDQDPALRRLDDEPGVLLTGKSDRFISRIIYPPAPTYLSRTAPELSPRRLGSAATKPASLG